MRSGNVIANLKGKILAIYSSYLNSTCELKAKYNDTDLPFAKLINELETLSQGSSSIDISTIRAALSAQEKNIVAACYYYHAIGLFKNLCAVFDSVQTLKDIESALDQCSAVQNSETEEKSVAKKSYRALDQIKECYRKSHEWYEFATNLQGMKSAKVNMDCLDHDYNMEIYDALTRCIKESKNSTETNALKERLIGLLTNRYKPQVAPLATLGRYADTTWLMLVADSGISLPILSNFVDVHPEAATAEILHQDRKSNDPGEYYGMSVATLAARKLNTEFFIAVADSLANDEKHHAILGQFINASNQKGSYIGSTPMMYFSCGGSAKAVQFLLNNGANFAATLPRKRKDAPLYTPLSFALRGIFDPEYFNNTTHFKKQYLAVAIEIAKKAREKLSDEDYIQYINRSLKPVFVTYQETEYAEEFIENLQEELGLYITNASPSNIDPQVVHNLIEIIKKYSHLEVIVDADDTADCLSTPSNQSSKRKFSPSFSGNPVNPENQSVQTAPMMTSSSSSLSNGNASLSSFSFLARPIISSPTNRLMASVGQSQSLDDLTAAIELQSAGHTDDDTPTAKRVRNSNTQANNDTEKEDDGSDVSISAYPKSPSQFLSSLHPVHDSASTPQRRAESTSPAPSPSPTFPTYTPSSLRIPSSSSLNSMASGDMNVRTHNMFKVYLTILQNSLGVLENKQEELTATSAQDLIKKCIKPAYLMLDRAGNSLSQDLKECLNNIESLIEACSSADAIKEFIKVAHSMLITSTGMPSSPMPGQRAIVQASQDATMANANSVGGLRKN